MLPDLFLIYSFSALLTILFTIVAPPPFLLGGGMQGGRGGWTSYQIFKKGGLDRTSTLTGGYWFSVITKKLIWEILTKNLVTFKKYNELRMKNFNVLGAHWKIPLLGGEFMKDRHRGGDCLKRGLGPFSNLKGGLARKRGWCFWAGVDTPMHTMFTNVLNKCSACLHSIFYLLFFFHKVTFDFSFTCYLLNTLKYSSKHSVY